MHVHHLELAIGTQKDTFWEDMLCEWLLANTGDGKDIRSNIGHRSVPWRCGMVRLIAVLAFSLYFRAMVALTDSAEASLYRTIDDRLRRMALT